jgi:hypothetical protein
MQPNGAGGRYRICWSEHHQQRVRQMRERARQLGREADFLIAVRHVADQLEAEPLSWGDPSYQLHQLGLAVRHGIYAMLHVYYAVDDEHQLVYIKDIDGLPGTGFELGA